MEKNIISKAYVKNIMSTKIIYMYARVKFLIATN